MRSMVCCLVVALLPLAALAADDKPKDEKPKQEEKKATPKEQYAELVKAFNAERSKLVPEIQKAKDDERQKLFQKYLGVGKEYAEKFYKLAEENPKDAVAADAVFWVLQNGNGSPVYGKAVDMAVALAGEMPLADLARRLNMIRVSDRKFMEAVFARAEKEEQQAQAADLLAWVASSGIFMPVGQKAVDRLVEKHPDHAAIERVCAMLGRGVPKGDEMLKKILEKSSKPRVKAAAALALGQALAAKVDQLAEKPAEADKLAAEAEKYFTMAIDQYGAENARSKKRAESELRALKTLRVGKPAPPVEGEDQDGKKFSLADYKGKVILLDFWQQF